MITGQTSWTGANCKRNRECRVTEQLRQDKLLDTNERCNHCSVTTTIHSIKKAYLEEKKENRAAQDDDDVAGLPPRKRGRPVLLGEDLDKKV